MRNPSNNNTTLFAKMENVLDTQLGATVIKLRQLLAPGGADFKERIHAARSGLFLELLHQNHRYLKDIILKIKQKTPDAIQKMNTATIQKLEENINKLKDLAEKIYNLTFSLPESSNIQKCLSKLNGFNANFMKFDTELNVISQNLQNSLVELSLAEPKNDKPLINTQSNEKQKAIEKDEKNLYKQFRKSVSKVYTKKSSTPEEEKEREKIVQQQVNSLQTYIHPETQPSLKSRIDKSLIIPSCELQIKRKLANGSVGSVFIASFRKQEVVIKTLEGIVGIVQQKELFNEIKIMSQTRSKYVTQLYGVCWEENFKCLIIEYMTKGSLYNCLSERVFSPDDQKQIALDVARGLLNLHASKMIHGNLSAYNVMINNYGEAKLTDFSCAKTLAVSLASVKQIRKPIDAMEWKAPELLSYSLLPIPTEKADIYSLGLVLYSLVTGKQPYQDLKNLSDDGALLDEIRKGEKSKFWVGNKANLKFVHETYVKIIQQCLSYYPDMRPDLSDIIDELERIKPTLEKENLVIQDLQDQASKKDYVALHNLGLRYLNGKGVNKDPEKAYQLIFTAADLGFIPSKIQISVMNANGFGTCPNLELAKQIYDGLSQNQIAVEKFPTAMNFLLSLISSKINHRQTLFAEAALNPINRVTPVNSEVSTEQNLGSGGR